MGRGRLEDRVRRSIQGSHREQRWPEDRAVVRGRGFGSAGLDAWESRRRRSGSRLVAGRIDAGVLEVRVRSVEALGKPGIPGTRRALVDPNRRFADEASPGLARAEAGF